MNGQGLDKGTGTLSPLSHMIGAVKPEMINNVKEKLRKIIYIIFLCIKCG